MYKRLIERFSTECRKTEIKAITLANHSRDGQSNEPIRTEANTCSRRQARENAREQVMIGFGFGARILANQQAVQNRCNCEITFDTPLQTALCLNSKSIQESKRKFPVVVSRAD